MILHTNSAGVLVIHLVIYCNSLLGLPNPGKVAAGSLRRCLLLREWQIADHADSVSRSARSSVRFYRVGRLLGAG